MDFSLDHIQETDIQTDRQADRQGDMTETEDQ